MTDTPARPIRPSVPLSIPLTLAAHQQAQQAYQQQPEPELAKQVYLNRLAVEAVRTYLQWMGYVIAPSADESDSAALLVLADLAELQVPGQGWLACRPVLPGEAVCRVPPESWAAALGYVAVGLDAELRQARLLGYGSAAGREEVPLEQLLPMGELLARLQGQSAAASVRVARKLVDLSQWLAGQVTSGWQAAEEVLGQQPPAFSFRSLELSDDPTGSVVRGKLLELVPSSKTSQMAEAPTDDWQFRGAEAAERHIEKHPVALLVGIIPNNALQYDIRIKLCPTGGDRTLPENLEIRVLDSQGLVAMEAQARQTDMLQLNFRGTSSEQFVVEVTLDQVTLTETFVI